MINASIFKAYDIRGIYPQDLNEENVFLIGQAFVNLTNAKEVVVGRDMRTSSPQLHKALIDGILSQGADVIDIGEVLTELIYFSVGFYGYDVGVMVTASHNPKEYNGIKMVKRDGDAIRIIRGKDLAEPVLEGKFKEVAVRGKIKEINPWQDYANHATSLFKTEEIKPFKVVIDAGNGMWGKFLPMIEKQLPIKVIPLNFELDGNFPAHPSNFLEPGATDQISAAIKKEKADFGFIFDGDGDRIRLIDEEGNMVDGDIALGFMSKYFLEKYPGISIPFTTPCSRALPELIEKLGGKPIRVPVGFVNVQDALIREKGIFGGEHPSAHYCFKENFYCDSGLFAFLILLNIVSKSNKKVSEMVKESYPYFRVPEIVFKIDNFQQIIDKIKEKYSDGKQDSTDGITVWYDDWWFNVRGSNTEPVLKLNIEASTKEILQEKSREIKDFISRGSSSTI